MRLNWIRKEMPSNLTDAFCAENLYAEIQRAFSYPNVTHVDVCSNDGITLYQLCPMKTLHSPEFVAALKKVHEAMIDLDNLWSSEKHRPAAANYPFGENWSDIVSDIGVWLSSEMEPVPSL